jgi:hypothetical protein
MSDLVRFFACLRSSLLFLLTSLLWLFLPFPGAIAQKASYQTFSPLATLEDVSLDGKTLTFSNGQWSPAYGLRNFDPDQSSFSGFSPRAASSDGKVIGGAFFEQGTDEIFSTAKSGRVKRVFRKSLSKHLRR